MPWAIFNRPSLQLATLKSYLYKQDDSLAVSSFHPYLSVAAALGAELYHAVSLDGWIGEAVYAALLFPEKYEEVKRFAGRRLRKAALATDVDFDEMVAAVGKATGDYLAEINRHNFDLIGFSICFYQLLPAVYAARLLKRKFPEIPIVFGGSGCPEAQGLVQNFEEVDYCITGEGEEALLALCHVLQGRDEILPSMVAARNFPVGQRATGDCRIADLQVLPVPDYSEYFLEKQQYFSSQPFIPVLPLEFSRGCWWNKCTFCNLNQQWQGYRAKSRQQMIAEVEQLSRAYQCLDFAFADNILPIREGREFFSEIAASGRDLSFFAEMRTSERKNFTEYSRAGLQSVQVGIEALSNSLLQKMNKGVSVIENLAAMKDAAAAGIYLEGNLIVEFPGSTEEEVAETLSNLDFARSFHPLTASAFFLGHGSPVDETPGRYGIQSISVHPAYKTMIPSAHLAGLTLPVKNYTGDLTRQKRMWKPVRKKVGLWKKFHNERHSLYYHQPLCYRDGGGFMIIRQEIPDGRVLHHKLQGFSRSVYLTAQSICTIEDLLKKHPSVKENSLIAFVEDLVAKKIFFRDGDKCLALAIRNGNR